MQTATVRLSEGDAFIDRAIVAHTRGFGGLHTHVFTQTDLATRKDEKLLAGYSQTYIFGRGNQTNIGGLTPSELAQLLVDNGINYQPIRSYSTRKYPARFFLYSSNSGLGPVSYALELKIEFVQKHRLMCEIIGLRCNLEIDEENSFTTHVRGMKFYIGEAGTISRVR